MKIIITCNFKRSLRSILVFNMASEQILNDEDFARQLQDDYYYSLASDEQKSTSDALDKSDNKSKATRESYMKTVWSSLFGRAEPEVPDDPTYTPEHYRDCQTEKQKIRWIQSPHGQSILSHRPVLLEFYNNGKLFKMINNPHWSARLNEWLFLQPGESVVPFGLSLPMNAIVKEQMKNRWMHTPHNNSPLNQMFTDHTYAYPVEFPQQNKFELLLDGYTIFRDIIPLHIVDAAQAAINNMIVNSDIFNEKDSKTRIKSPINEDPFFTSGVTNDRNVLALFYQTPVYALVESILHNNSSHIQTLQQSQLHKNKGDDIPQYHNFTQGAQVAYRFSEARPMHAHGRKLGGLGWHIDGMDKGQYGSFSFLIGFPLSDQSQDFSGNLCLHAGSHNILNTSYCKPYAEKVLEINGGKPPSEQVEVRVPKPTLEEPVQVKVNRGDCVFALHKIGHRGGPNYSEHVRKMVYMRVSNKRHGENKMKSLDHLWLDYEGMYDIL